MDNLVVAAGDGDALAKCQGVEGDEGEGIAVLTLAEVLREAMLEGQEGQWVGLWTHHADHVFVSYVGA